MKSEKDKSYYVGITKDLDLRLKVHNRGGLKTTAAKRPWEIIYKKGYNSYHEARKHEKWLKKKSKQYKAKLAG